MRRVPSRRRARLGCFVPAILGALALTGPSVRASQRPAWLVTVLNAPAPPVKLEGSTVMLLNEATVRYLPGGKTRETVREVLRVETTEGVAVAGAGRPYNADTDRVLNAQAWIIPPDGSHTDSFGLRDFFDFVALANDYVWNSVRVIAFTPGNRVTVGGIVAIEMEIERQTGTADFSWAFLEPRPVAKSVLEIIPMPGDQLVYYCNSAQVPAPVPGEAPGSLRWEMHDLVTMPRNLPAGFVPNLRWVSVRCLGSDSPATQMKTWGQFAGLAARTVEPRMIAAPAVAAETQALVHGKVDRWDRIRALAEYVQKQVAYLSVQLDKDSLAGYRPHLPADVLQSHLGDCKDKSTLLVTMLRSAGEKAYAVLVHASNLATARPEWPTEIFNHMVVGIQADAAVPAGWPVVDGGSLGKLVIFDPTDLYTPLGTLPFSDQGALGLLAAPEANDLVTLPSEEPDHCVTTRQVAGEVTANGDLAAAVDEVFHGTRAAAVFGDQVRLGDANFRKQLEGRFHSALPLLSDLTWKNDWFPIEARDHLAFTFKAPGAMRHLRHDALLICPRLAVGDHPYQLWKTDWEGAVWLPALRVTEEVKLLLPEGFTPESLPSDVQQELPFVTASLTYRLDGRTLVYARQYFRKACFLGKSDYDSIYLFNQKLDEAERRPAIIRRPSQPSSAGPATPP